MSPIKKSEITFYQVRTSQEKLKLLIDIASKYFCNKDPLVFLTPSSAASAYLDNLLWQRPQDSFLPHGIYSPLSQEIIQISERLPAAPHPFKTLFNLCTKPLLDSDIKKIFELEDLTSAEKISDFTPRYEAYASAGFRIISSCN